MKTKILLVLFLFALFACEKVEVLEKGGQNGNSTPSFDFEVPAGFTWAVHKPVDVSIKVADQYDGRFYYGVAIYDGDDLLGRGFVKGDKDFSAIINVKSVCTYLTVEQLDPNGNKAKVDVPINGNSIVLDLANLPYDEAATKSMPVAVVSRGSGGITVPDDAYEVTGDVTNDKPLNGVVVHVKKGGTYTCGPNAKWKNSEIYVSEGGKLILTSCGKCEECSDDDDEECEHRMMNMTIVNEGEVEISGDIDFDDDDFNKKSLPSFITNTGTGIMTFDHDVEFLGDLKNHGTMTFMDDLELEEGSTLLTTGCLTVIDDLELEKGVTATVGSNAGLEAGSIDLEHGSKLLLESLAMIKVVELDCGDEATNHGSLIGPPKGDYAVIEAESIELYKKTLVTGRLVLDCDDIDVEEEEEEEVGHWNSSIYIGDNPGAGVVVIDNECLKYNHVVDSTSGSLPLPDTITYLKPIYTIVMEDNYPAVGDMDMNDIVCEWQIGKLNNTDKSLFKVGIKYTIKALGGTKKLAGAVALHNIERSDIKSVTLSKPHDFPEYFNVSNGLETENSDVVIPLFEDAHKTFFGRATPGFVNTFSVTEEPYTFEVVIELNSSSSIGSINQESFDFFLVLDGDKVKRTEVHLFDNKVTAKASNNKETNNKETNNKETNPFLDQGFVWGIELTEDFAYPKELISIKNAYPDFEEWVKTSGGENKEWYKNPVGDKVIIWQK